MLDFYKEQSIGTLLGTVNDIGVNSNNKFINSTNRQDNDSESV